MALCPPDLPSKARDRRRHNPALIRPPENHEEGHLWEVLIILNRTPSRAGDPSPLVPRSSQACSAGGSSCCEPGVDINRTGPSGLHAGSWLTLTEAVRFVLLSCAIEPAS